MGAAANGVGGYGSRLGGRVALSSTQYRIELSVSDTDRGVYETLELQVARHPSETTPFLVTRLLAFALQYTDGLSFSRGLGEPDEPAIWAHDLTGRLRLWVDIGTPSAARLHRASKAADAVVVYCHKDPGPWLQGLYGERIHKAEFLQVVLLDRAWVAAIAALLERRTALDLTVSEGELFVDLAGQTLHTVPEVRSGLP